MSTPLEVIEAGREDFSMNVDLSNQDTTRWLKTQDIVTLTLLQALHDELKENSVDFYKTITHADEQLKKTQVRSMEIGYNRMKKDQQDNLQALMNSIRV